MYYVKTVIKTDGIIETALTQDLCDGEDGNIFTQCPSCGDEIHVDLAEIFAHGGDLFSTSSFCKSCIRNGKQAEFVDFMTGKRDTFNGKTREEMETEAEI